ncbi:uncharacterized protein EDB93DRAFT_1265832 [Suillus bovinus]|uniref:uncharacterized protein n=1 Tax=Suillus bovinus TaxID=48563 RepID=UPI001B85DF22|nr:uncharacterized protein EDB93DRAFT_1265832 [Suillus bovinus]KAG2129251.1 hypothetical protein EDB93DRAFT_1265832 [Suillus bovinus]
MMKHKRLTSQTPVKFVDPKSCKKKAILVLAAPDFNSVSVFSLKKHSLMPGLTFSSAAKRGKFSLCQDEAKEKGVTLPMTTTLAVKGEVYFVMCLALQEAIQLIKEKAAKQAKEKAVVEKLAEEEQLKKIAEAEVKKSKEVVREEEAVDSETLEEEKEEEEDNVGGLEDWVITQPKCKYSTTPPKGKKATQVATVTTSALVAGPSCPAPGPVTQAISLSEENCTAPHLVARGSKREAVEMVEDKDLDEVDEVDEELQRQFEVMESQCQQAEGLLFTTIPPAEKSIVDVPRPEYLFLIGNNEQQPSLITSSPKESIKEELLDNFTSLDTPRGNLPGAFHSMPKAVQKVKHVMLTPIDALTPLHKHMELDSPIKQETVQVLNPPISITNRCLIGALSSLYVQQPMHMPPAPAPAPALAPIALQVTMSTIPYHMPICGTDCTPKFDGTTANLLDFIDAYEEHTDQASLAGLNHIKQIICYLAPADKELWACLPEAKQGKLFAGAVVITAICAQYTTLLMAQPEITTHVEYLHEHRSEAEGGGNFKTKVFADAADYINNNKDLTATHMGPPKTAKLVQNKWTSLKGIYHAIEKYRNQTGVHWDNQNVVGIAGSAAADVWGTYIQKNHLMHQFHDKGWDQYEKMQAIIPLGGARGQHAFHPGGIAPSITDADSEPGGTSNAVVPAGAVATSAIATSSATLAVPTSSGHSYFICCWLECWQMPIC